MESVQHVCGTLYPLGYRLPGADAYFRAVMSDIRTCIVEARFTPFARNRPAWCRYGKLGLEQVWQTRYHYFSSRTQGFDQNNENWLGNRNYNTGGPIELVNATRGVEMLAFLLQQRWNVVLLCGCPEYDECHRKRIVEMLLRILPSVCVEHQPGTKQWVVEPASLHQLLLF